MVASRAACVVAPPFIKTSPAQLFDIAARGIDTWRQAMTGA